MRLRMRLLRQFDHAVAFEQDIPEFVVVDDIGMDAANRLAEQLFTHFG